MKTFLTSASTVSWSKGESLSASRCRPSAATGFSTCVDDPERYRAERWRSNREDGRPTCPRCVEFRPYDYPGMLLVVRGGLGIPQIVRVTADEEWIGVLGIGKDRIVNAESKQVLHVCQEGDVFEDVGVVVENGKLVKYTAASEAQIEKLGPPASREEMN